MRAHYCAEDSIGSEIALGRLGRVHVIELCEPGAGESRAELTDLYAGLYKVHLLIDGRTVARTNGKEVPLRPGDFVLTDASRPFRCVFESGRAVCVAFPKELLPLPEDEVAEVLDVPIAGRAGVPALVASLIARLPGCLDDVAGAADGVRLSTAMLDLLSVALATRLEREDATVPPADRTKALLTRIHAFVEEHLGDPGLTPTAVADAHHISLRYLYKVFEREGCGVADWIRRRRLERCRHDLLDPALADRPVSATGARWGFPDAARFTRSFRAAYGMPPAEYRRLAGDGEIA